MMKFSCLVLSLFLAVFCWSGTTLGCMDDPCMTDQLGPELPPYMEFDSYHECECEYDYQYGDYDGTYADRADETDEYADYEDTYEHEDAYDYENTCEYENVYEEEAYYDYQESINEYDYSEATQYNVADSEVEEERIAELEADEYHVAEFEDDEYGYEYSYPQERYGYPESLDMEWGDEQPEITGEDLDVSSVGQNVFNVAVTLAARSLDDLGCTLCGISHHISMLKR